MSKIKILICINNLYVGGAQRQLQKQLPHFNFEKFEISVLSFDADHERTSAKISFPENVSYYHVQMRNLYDLGGWFGAYKVVSMIKPDVVMTSMFFANTVGRVIALVFGIPSIARYHNTFDYSSKLQKIIDTFLAKRTKYLVGVSQDVADHMKSILPTFSKKIVSIPNGIDLSVDLLNSSVQERSEIRSSLGIATETQVLLSVGRLVKQKNHQLMLEGFAMIKAKYPQAELLLVGEGGMLEKLKNLANQLQVNVRFVGHLDDVHPYYKTADVYISTSFVEGMSNTHLEALAHGLPIITTKTGGVNELIQEGQNGFIVEEMTSDAILNAYERYLAADQMQLSLAALTKVREFDIKKTVRIYESLWEQVLK